MRRIVLFLVGLLLAPAAFAGDTWPDTHPRSCVPLGGFLNPDESAATYLNLVDSTQGSTDAAEDMFLVPIDATVSSLRVEVDVAPGGIEVWEITVMDDGVATNVVCEIEGAAVTCNSAEFSADVVAASDMTVRVQETGDGAPANAAEMKIALCLSGG